MAGRAAGSVLAEAFSGQLPVNGDGYVFIDRDPELFGKILFWLRTGEVMCSDATAVELLRKEAVFFQVINNPVRV